MNHYFLLAALRARYRIFLFILGATVLATTVVSLLLPKSYVSTVALMVDSKDEQSIGNAQLAPVRERTGYMQTQIDLITSPKAARKVVDELRLTESPTIRAEFEEEPREQGSIEDWLTETLLKRLKVDTSQSSVIQLAFTSVDAKFSALVANAFAKAYIDTTLALRVEPLRQTAAWFDEQIKELRDNLVQSQTRLVEYQKKNGIVSLEERFDVDSTVLSDLSAQVTKAQEQSYDSTSRQQQANAVLRGSASPERLPEILSNPFIQGIKTDLLRSETKLQELASRLGSRHPSYQSQLSETQILRDRLKSEMEKIVDGIGNSVQQNRRRESDLRSALAAQQTRILDFKQSRYQVGILVRDVDAAQKAYETAMQRAVDSRVESHARLTNVNVLYAAVAPFKAARPRIGLNIGLSVAVGILLGLSIVYLMEMLDHRVRSLADLENDLHVPLLIELNSWRPVPGGLLAGPIAGRALPRPS